VDTDAIDWLVNAPIPCPTCGGEAVAKIAILKAHDSIRCRYCGTAIDLTDAGTRAFIEEFSSVVASLFWSSADTVHEGDSTPVEQAHLKPLVPSIYFRRR
jgi:hypothetical protein